MNLTYDLTIVDYINFNEHHFKTRSNFLQKNLRYILFFFFLIYIMFSLEKPLIEEVWDWSYWAILAFAVGMWYFLDRRLFRSRKSAIISSIKANPTLVGKREVSLTDDKIILTGEGTKFEYDYNIITSIEEDNSLIYIYISQQNAILIPKRFTGNEELLSILKTKTA